MMTRAEKIFYQLKRKLLNIKFVSSSTHKMSADDNFLIEYIKENYREEVINLIFNDYLRFPGR